MESDESADAARIRNFKDRLVKTSARHEFVYYSLFFDVEQCRKNISIAIDAMRPLESNSYIIIYGYGMLGVACRLACLMEGKRILQIVDREKCLSYDFVDGEIIMCVREDVHILIASEYRATEIIDICRGKGYSDKQWSAPFRKDVYAT